MKIVEGVGLEARISLVNKAESKDITSEENRRFILKNILTAEVDTLYKLSGDRGEALELIISTTGHGIDRHPLSNLDQPILGTRASLED